MLMFDRAILHLDLDAFFASVECLRNVFLKGKPLIIGGASNRGVVASCSYEARAFGIRTAMPMRMARQLCPDAVIIRGDMEAYSKHSQLVREIINEDAPLFEQASIDEFYIDLTGADRFIGCAKWSGALRQKIIKHSGLPISAGLAVNKLISKMATTEAKPRGNMQIKAGEEKAFIAPMPTARIPSVGKTTARKLSFMGIRTIRTLSQIPKRLLQREFGKSGKSLWEKANAIDHSPVVPFSEKKSISTERTFQVDTINMRQLKSQLSKMTDQLTFELRQAKRLTSCVTVKIRYTDFNTYTKQKKIPYTANDRQIQQLLLELFEQLYNRRQLIRLIGIRFSGLVNGHDQLHLFDDHVRDKNLQQAMDRIRKRFGKNAVMRASSIL